MLTAGSGNILWASHTNNPSEIERRGYDQHSASVLIERDCNTSSSESVQKYTLLLGETRFINNWPDIHQINQAMHISSIYELIK